MPIQNKCDIHTHTIFSGHAYSTICENVRAASEAGLELLGSTDHYSSMLFPDYRSAKNYQYLAFSKNWPREWMGITLLRGVEADIVDRDGRLFGEDIQVDSWMTGDPFRDGKSMSLYQWVTGNLDYVIASVHGKVFTTDMAPAQITDMYLNALRRPEVLMLGHIGRTGLDFDVEEVLRVSKEMNKPVEINEHSFAFPESEIIPRCRRIAERCAELGIAVAVSTDAHICKDVGQTEGALRMLEEIRFPEELIITRDRETFLSELKRAVSSFEYV